MSPLVKVDTSEADFFVKQLGFFRRLFKSRAAKKLPAFGEATLGAHIRGVGFGGRPYLISRSGAMQSSVVVATNTEEASLSYNIKSKHPGINVQIHGATIVPVKKKALTIPLASAFSGGLRLYPTPVNPSEFKVIRRGGKGNSKGYLVHKSSHTVTHRLVKSVRVPGRLDMKSLGLQWWEKYYKPEIIRVIGGGIKNLTVSIG